MSNHGGVRNIERLKRALEQLQKLTPQDIQKLNQQQSIHELRLKRLAFHQPRQQVAPPLPEEPSQPNQQSQYNPNEMSEVRNSNPDASSSEVVRVSGVRWSIFNQDPAVSANKHQHKQAPDYQSSIDHKVDEWRKIFRQEGIPTSTESPRQRQMFSSVFSKQKGPTKPLEQNQSQQGLIFPQFPNQVLNNINKKTNNSINSNVDFSKLRGSIFSNKSKEFKDSNLQNLQANDLKNTFNQNLRGQDKKQHNITNVNNANMGFVPGLFTTQNRSSIFDRKLQTPQVLPPQPIKTNKGLFSQFNPLSTVKVQSKPIFNNNSNVTSNQGTQNLFNNSLTKADEKPKINIFAKTLNQVEIEAPRPLDSKSGLFSSHNPIAELQTQKPNLPKKDQPSANLFNNNIFAQNVSNVQKIQPTSLFSSNNQATKQTPTAQSTQKPQNFLTGGLFSKKQQNKVNIFDNSLFSNSIKPNLNIQTQPQNTAKVPQKQTKPQFLSNPFSNQQAQRPESKKENQQQKPSLFSFAKNTNQPKASDNVLATGTFNTFQASKNKAKQQRFQKPTNFFAPKQQSKQPTTSLFSQASSQSEKTNSNLLGNSIFGGATDKPKNNIFVSSTPAPPLFLNTTPTVTPEGSQHQKKATPNIFGTVGLPLPKVQNSEKLEQKSIFDHKGPTTNIFSKPLHQNKQSLFGGANPPKLNIFSMDKRQQVKNQNNEQSQQKASSSVKKKPNQLFGDFIKSKPQNMFSSKDPKANIEGGLFPKSSESANIFTAAATKNNTLFGKSSNSANIFLGSTNSMFATNAPSKKQDQDEEIDEEGDDDQLIEDKEEIDPSKSTGNFKYEQSTIVYRQTVPKFKKGTQNILQNVILSIQRFAGLQNCTLAVRLANKCLYFSGTIQPKLTEISKIKQGQFRNLSIKKIMTIGQDGKPSLQLLKIQFKDEKQGELFYNKFCQVNKK